MSASCLQLRFNPFTGNFDWINVPEPLESASPGYSLGRAGNTPAGTWLLRPGGPPSNKTGLPINLAGASVIKVSIGNDLVTTFDVELFEHEGNATNLTSIGTVSVVASRTAVASVSFPVTTGKQLAAQIKSGNPSNPGVDIQMTGSAV